jgi:hypothetical protein
MAGLEFQFKDHAVFRMLERGISEEEVRQTVLYGACIERYDDDLPYPSRLMFMVVNGRPLHVVVANASEQLAIVITTYIPDTITFMEDFRTRR